MDKTSFEVEFQKLFKIFGDFLDKYEEATPELERITLVQLVYDAILSLKTHIEDPEEKEITSSNPFVELQYPVEVDREKLSPLAFALTDKDLLDVKKASEILTEGFLQTKGLFIFRALCNDTALLKEGDSQTLLLSEDVIEYLNMLPEKKRQKTLKKIEAQTSKDITSTLEFSIKGQVTDLKGRERKFSTILFLDFRPLVLERDFEKAYYPVIVGFRFRGFKPTGWSEKDKHGFWETFLPEIKALIPKETIPKTEKGDIALTGDVSFTLTPGSETVAIPPPTPTVRPVTPGIPLIRASLHTEKQKFGTKQGTAQRSLFELLEYEETRNKAVEYGIQDVIGIDLTEAQTKALFAIQRLLQETDYRGNFPSEYLDENNRWKFRGELPTLKFSPAQYLEAYGVRKFQTARGYMEFSGEERKDALRALIDLAKKQHIFVYKRVYWEKDKKGKDEERVHRVETIDTLIKITQGWEALTKQEDRILDTGKSTKARDDKLKVIAISPCPILVDQVDRYFVPKPATCYQEIKLLVGYASKYVYRFVDFLLTEVAQREIASKGKGNQNWTIERSPETLAYALRMDAWIKNKQ